jgi:hypothetical protein
VDFGREVVILLLKAVLTLQYPVDVDGLLLGREHDRKTQNNQMA